MAKQTYTVDLKINPKRKSLALQVINNLVVIKSPISLTRSKIDALLKSNQPFIEKQLSKSFPLLSFKSGELLYYLGKPYRLKICKAEKANVSIYMDEMIVYQKENDPALSKQLILNFYYQQAHNILMERVNILSQACSLYPTKITIKNFKSRFGSCDSKQHIKLNWRLIMALPEVIDYVVIHELCHLRHFNHSKAFWELVEKHHPKVGNSKQWLKTYTSLLMHTM